MFPCFILLSFIENGIRLIQWKKILRANDTMASISQGIFQECIRVNIRSVEVLMYTFIYTNYRIADINWNSTINWFICFLGVDLGFYTYHRLSHEINILWAVHQAHHSAEDFTMISSLRQAVLQPFIAGFAYLPMAFFVTPSIFLVHLQLSELYMIWIHTEIIDRLGFLELILNTPSHHRVHHGRNRKYIDKNYAGTLIIWDRLFGTFEPEDDNEPVAYGLVKPIQSYNPFWIQFHHFFSVYQRLRTTEGFKNKLFVLIKGPGWQPGDKSRFGDINQVPVITYPVKYWSPEIPFHNKLYTLWHFLIILIFYALITNFHDELTQLMVFFYIIILLFSITSIGFILEGRKFAFIIELTRCITFVLVDNYVLTIAVHLFSQLYLVIFYYFFKYTFIISIFFSIFNIFESYKADFNAVVHKAKYRQTKIPTYYNYNHDHEQMTAK